LASQVSGGEQDHWWCVGPVGEGGQW
jgi:hypothetical protein